MEEPKKAFENLQNPRQHGFRKSRETNTTTTILYETMATAIGNKNKVNIVLRVINEAFDKIWHEGLNYKLIVTSKFSKTFNQNYR